MGGQRNERKKWIHCFDDVTAVIFVAALSEYDQALFEDATANRMTEAVDLFGDICNNKVFQSSSMILFLNKKDLYEEKINVVHIGDQPAFANFDAKLGDADYYEKGIQYFLDMFMAQNSNPERQIYNHATCATDSKNVEVVFNSCKDIIMRKVREVCLLYDSPFISTCELIFVLVWGRTWRRWDYKSCDGQCDLG